MLCTTDLEEIWEELHWVDERPCCEPLTLRRSERNFTGWMSGHVVNHWPWGDLRGTSLGGWAAMLWTTDLEEIWEELHWVDEQPCCEPLTLRRSERNFTGWMSGHIVNHWPWDLRGTSLGGWAAMLSTTDLREIWEERHWVDERPCCEPLTLRSERNFTGWMSGHVVNHWPWDLRGTSLGGWAAMLSTTDLEIWEELHWVDEQPCCEPLTLRSERNFTGWMSGHVVNHWPWGDLRGTSLGGWAAMLSTTDLEEIREELHWVDERPCCQPLTLGRSERNFTGWMSGHIVNHWPWDLRGTSLGGWAAMLSTTDLEEIWEELHWVDERPCCEPLTLRRSERNFTGWMSGHVVNHWPWGDLRETSLGGWAAMLWTTDLEEIWEELHWVDERPCCEPLTLRRSERNFTGWMSGHVVNHWPWDLRGTSLGGWAAVLWTTDLEEIWEELHWVDERPCCEPLSLRSERNFTGWMSGHVVNHWPWGDLRGTSLGGWAAMLWTTDLEEIWEELHWVDERPCCQPLTLRRSERNFTGWMSGHVVNHWPWGDLRGTSLGGWAAMLSTTDLEEIWEELHWVDERPCCEPLTLRRSERNFTGWMSGHVVNHWPWGDLRGTSLGGWAAMLSTTDLEDIWEELHWVDERPCCQPLTLRRSERNFTGWMSERPCCQPLTLRRSERNFAGWMSSHVVNPVRMTSASRNGTEAHHQVHHSTQANRVERPTSQLVKKLPH